MSNGDNVLSSYILTIYKVVINENNIHIVSHIREPDKSGNDLLKYKKQNISGILHKHAILLYNEILSNYNSIDSCPLIEICRHVCDSVDAAKQIIANIITINNRDTSCKYMCYKCKFYTNTECHWLKHLFTTGHNQKINATKNKLFDCEKCNICFLSRTSLWKHKKTCQEIPNPPLHNVQHHIIYDISTDTDRQQAQNDDIVKELTTMVREQHVVIDKIIELQKAPLNNNITNTTTNNITNNTSNNFNLKIFLHETCKNAITVKEFLENIHVGVDTVEYTGEHGFVAGISKIIIDELVKLGCNTRPIHCTDAKRETLYIKDENGWEKDNEEKKLLIKLIRIVAQKNIGQLNEWRRENPMCEVNDSKAYNMDINIMKQCNGNNNETLDHKRICNNIIKATNIKELRQ